MSRRQPAVAALGRLVDSSEFVRVLQAPSRARTVHFAVHHVPVATCAVEVAAPGRLESKLSTVAPSTGASPVDDLCRCALTKQFGAVVPKRHARRAVTRSLLKRLVYAAGDQHAGALDIGLWIVRLRAPFDRTIYPSASSQALRAAARAELESLFDALDSARAA